MRSVGQCDTIKPRLGIWNPDSRVNEFVSHVVGPSVIQSSPGQGPWVPGSGLGNLTISGPALCPVYLCTIKSRPCPMYLESIFWSESVSPVVTGQRSVIQSMYNYNPGAFGCGSEVKIYEHYNPALSSIFVKSVKYRRVRYSKQESLNQHETFVWQASLYLWKTLLQQMFDIGKR